MRNPMFLAVIASVIMFSCSKEDDQISATLKAEFTAEITGEAPAATLTITNNSEGADSYEWTFGEGFSEEESTSKTPANVTIDKVGELSITLKAKKGGEEKMITKTVNVTGHNAVVTYNDLEFGHELGDDTYGNYFSFTSGEVIKESEITADNGSTIHLVYQGYDNTLYFFDNPSSDDYDVPGATTSKIMNYEITPTFTVQEFDDIADDRDIVGLAITNSDDSFGNGQVPGTVLFEISDGRKGVIKTEMVNSSRIQVDIKIQKYAGSAQ